MHRSAPHHTTAPCAGNVAADNEDDSDSESATEMSPPASRTSSQAREGSPYRGGGAF